MPENLNFRLPRAHRFLPKFDFTVKVPNHSGDPLMFILGPMGSHWVQKMGRNRKNYYARNSNFQLHRSHRFRPKFEFRVMAPNEGGDPLGSILGPMGSHWSKKWVKTVKNYHAPEFKFSTTQRSLISTKIRLDGYGAKSRWGHPRVHLGANGVPLGPKNGSKSLKITMPQNSNFRLPRGHRFRPKFDFTVMAPNHRGDPLGSILGPMGSSLGPKNGSKP